MGHPLIWFKGDSEAYVFLSDVGIQDYDNDYEDLSTLIELLGVIISRETGDDGFAGKIVRLLALKLGVEHQLRESPLSDQEYLNIIIKRAKQRTKKVGIKTEPSSGKK
jgi:hypothetical protein